MLVSLDYSIIEFGKSILVKSEYLVSNKAI